ncbi:MAG TPA: SusC/RagA family TonB-linked outer membrane protein [Porphyromonadaceae bacterium]|nr:SusC/RagA family TonB-linked outer membrane protein [Porphyromonadaceae bacterium]HCM21209.1 SusC/RagA family TonB-linked outer membrane protein [Porphyromonadaceae bacterium]
MKIIVVLILFGSSSVAFSSNTDYNEIKTNAANTSGVATINDIQQKVKVTGRVVDQDGFPMPGVMVAVKERKGVGVATDSEGKYTLECDANETLVFSFIGFTSFEEKAKSLNDVTVTLKEDVVSLDEVQVVAFGKQKKESVVGSITTITPGELRVPSSNLTTAFAGRMAGVIAYQRSGEPGLDNAEFFIRGVTTFGTGKRDPLILIDGIEMESTDLARLNVDDIASFSVMKDANASALYGSRAANGVILVTTKEGKPDKISVNIRAELSSSGNTDLVDLADPVTYMRLHNEAVRTRDAMLPLPYSSTKIRETELGTDPLRYPAVDWYDYLIKDRTFNQRVNMNITGGGKAVQYYLAANYQHDTGIIKESAENLFNNNIDINRIQIRSNVTIKFLPTTTGIIRAYGSFDDTTGPKSGVVDGKEVSGGVYTFHMARNASPVQFLPYYPKDEANELTKHTLFGMGDEVGTYTNPLAQILSAYEEKSESMMLMQMEFDHKFTGSLEGLFAKAVYNVKRNSFYRLSRSYKPFYYSLATTLDGSYQLTPLNPDDGTEYLDYDDKQSTKTVTATQYGELRLGYDKTINDVHDINTLLVGTIRNESGIGDPKLLDYNGLYATLPRRNISTAGRLAYGYDSRYFFEFNFGYNGSERFAKKYRFGFFPSIGAGWMVSNEKFMSGVKDVISTLKLKGTYGIVGNDVIGNKYDRFFYLSRVNMSGEGYWFGTDRKYKSGISIGRYANDQISWEMAYKTDLGIELGLYKDLTILANYFTETRKNILQTRQDIPSTMGLRETPLANLGVAKGKGFEVELKYQKSFNKDLWAIINGNFTYASSKYKEFEEADYSDVPWKSHIGQKINQSWGYIAERLFIDDEDVNNSPRQELGGKYGAGDLKYKDINNDGVINSDDMVPIGYPTVPEIVYGTGFSVGYKGFDLSCFFQGSARSSFFINSSSITPFTNKGQRALLQYIADDHWSENNRNIYAFWPRLSEYQIENNNVLSTHWLRDGSFIRLKSAEFGYTLPTKLTKKFHLEMLRFYASGSNLFVWSKFKMWDPEMAGNGLGYPIQRVLNLGININF